MNLFYTRAYTRVHAHARAFAKRERTRGTDYLTEIPRDSDAVAASLPREYSSYLRSTLYRREHKRAHIRARALKVMGEEGGKGGRDGFCVATGPIKRS